MRLFKLLIYLTRRQEMRTTLATIFMALTCLPALADWKYDETIDKMSGKKTAHATMESSNSLDLSFPYKGANHGNLTVRQHPSYGLDVIFSIDKGQLLCSSYDGCNVSVKFDDKPPVKFSASSAADHDSKVIFLRTTSRFVESARKAKTILIQPTVYQAGSPVLEFKTSAPLQWTLKK
jgi:hypothetical protein